MYVILSFVQILISVFYEYVVFLREDAYKDQFIVLFQIFSYKFFQVCFFIIIFFFNSNDENYIEQIRGQGSANCIEFGIISPA